jgi:HAD superfamily hydrolase (TIGR01457 family)
MKTRLDDLKFFLLDMDGTIYLGSRVIPGAPEFIRFLRETGRKFLFFTNNPTSSARQYSDKLCGMGIDAAPADVLTSGEATVSFLLHETQYRRLCVLGTPSFESELAEAGFAVNDPEPEAVVLAFDKTLTYAKLERACLLLQKGLPYFATNPDRVCPTDYGYIPDCGAIAALIESATGRSPRFIGKPNKEMIDMGMLKLGANKEQTAMVGDRLYTDMEMAFRSGVTPILVLSGESSQEDADQSGRRPDYIFKSIDELRRAMCEGA